MTTSQKAALSLLIAVLLFGAFTALTYTGLFELIETRFYNPSITSSLAREISRNSESIDSLFSELETLFSATLRDSAVKRSFLSNQTSEDIYERSRVYGLLIESIGGLQWIRFIDSGGARIHFSTYSADILQQTNQSISYHNYESAEFPYSAIAVYDGGTPKYIFDGASDRILFSFPFYDSFDVYRGTALFSLSIRAVSERLINEGRITIGQDFAVISSPQGLLYGVELVTEKALANEVAAIWGEGGLSVARLDSPDSNISLALISVKASQGFFVGRLVDEELFSFPQAMKLILLASFFITVYLTIFLLFNLRQDSVTIVQNRMRQLQIALIEQYYERKGDVDWKRWSRELEQRREEISIQLKQGIKAATGSKKDDIDVLIDKSWDELLSVIGNHKDTTLDEEKLQLILNRFLAALPGGGATPIQISSQISPKPDSSSAPASQAKAEETPKEASPEEIAEEAELLETFDEVAKDDETQGPPEESGKDASVEGEEAVEELEELGEAEELTEGEETAVTAAEAEEDVEELEELTEGEETAMPTVEENVEELEELAEGEETAEIAEEAEEAEEASAISEVPIIDAAEIASEDLVNEAVLVFGPEEGVEELEELAETEELEEPETPIVLQTPAQESADSEMSIERLASQIEFSPSPEPETTEEVTIQDDLEIVSPFSTLLDFSLEDNDSQAATEPSPPDEEGEKAELPDKTDPEAEIAEPSPEENKEDEEGEKKNLTVIDSREVALPEDKGIVKSFSLINKPFQNFSHSRDIETLEPLPNEEKINNTEEFDIIKEREGIHYISKEALDTNPEPDANIDQDFKNLVDSIIK